MFNYKKDQIKYLLLSVIQVVIWSLISGVYATAASFEQQWFYWFQQRINMCKTLFCFAEKPWTI